ncbi:hypothetical protein MMPV_004404 [Pyropia vietnamensis]
MQHYLHDTATRERVAAMMGWTHFNERETPPGRRSQALSGALWHPIPTVVATRLPDGRSDDGNGDGQCASNGDRRGDSGGSDGDGGKDGEHGGSGGLAPVRLALSTYRPPGGARVPFADAAAAAYAPAAVGEALGPAWATVWFRVDLELPPWVAALPGGAPPPAAAGHTCPPGVDDRLCLVWDAGAEALVWSADGQPRAGLVGGRGMCSRVDYDLGKDVDVAAAAAAATRATAATTATPLHVRLYVEVACNGLFGVGAGGDIEPPDSTKTFALATARVALRCETAWTLLHDLTALSGMADALPDGAPQKRAALSAANNLVNAVRVRDLRHSANAASSAATVFWATSPPAPGASTPTVAAVGHCHIDTAWLWVMAEARRKVARSWASQLRLLNEYPAYIFAASQALHYAWVEDNYPTLWTEVVAAVRRGGWSVVGGTWVEMDTNIPTAEALVRQFTVGQGFFRSRFSVRVRTLWLPDTFGFAPQLPQLAVQAGMSRFLTQKLSWNRWTKMPHSTFAWVGLDGSRLLTHCPPADTYASTAEAGDILRSSTGNKTAPWINGSMLLFGHGDGGGGPTAAMLESLSRFSGVDGMPRVRLASPDLFFDEASKAAASMDRIGGLPVHHGEMYLQLHRGTLTSQGATKRGNAVAEVALLTADLVTALAATATAAAGGDGGDFVYPAEELVRLWRLVLTHAFHDILPGSAIAAVYKEAEADYASVVASSAALVAAAVRGGFPHATRSLCPSLPGMLSGVAILSRTIMHEPPVLRLPQEVAAAAQAVGALTQPAGPPLGASFPTAPFTDDLRTGLMEDDVLVLAAEAPRGIGLFPLHVTTVTSAATRQIQPVLVKPVLPDDGGGYTMTNGRLSAHVDASGLLRQLSLANDGRTGDGGRVEVLAPGGVGNRLVVWDDALMFWDAWDTSVARREKVWTTDDATVRVSLLAQGPLRATIHVEWPRLLPSLRAGATPAAAAQQWLSLDAGSGRLDIVVAMDWAAADRQLLRFQVDTAFSTATSYATGTQFGWVSRPSHANTPGDAAAFESCGQRFADVSTYGGGVALLSDCRYGYSAAAGEGTLWLSLLRAPRCPDPTADIGRVHVIRMALVPHATAWPVASVPACADAVASPPTVVPVASAASGGGDSLLAGVAIDAGGLQSVRVAAVKLADAPADAMAGTRRPLVVRAYEGLGGTGGVRLRVTSSLGRLERAVATNILEDVSPGGATGAAEMGGGQNPPAPPSERVFESGVRPRDLPISHDYDTGDGLVRVQFGAFQVRTLLLYFAPLGEIAERTS